MELLRRLLRWLNGRPDKVMYIMSASLPGARTPLRGYAP